MKTHNSLPVELAPCGVFCGACPSFQKTCFGCASDDISQKRSSKWGCKIRNCCYNEKHLDYCVHCSSFPCKLINKKLINSHIGDTRFTYRHQIPEVFNKLKYMSLDKYLEFQKESWKCKSCGGNIHFYLYTCNNCGKKCRY